MDGHAAASRVARNAPPRRRPRALNPILSFFSVISVFSVVNPSSASQPDLPRLIPAFRRAMNAAIGGPSQSCVLTNW